MQQDDVGLQSYLEVFWRRKWAILAVFATIFGLSVAGILVSKTKYIAEASVAVKNQMYYRPSLLSFSQGTDEATTTMQPESYEAIINDLPFAAKVADALLKEALPLDPAEVSSSINAVYQEPDLIRISATRTVPEEAITLANVSAKVFEDSTRERMNESLTKGLESALGFQERSRAEITEYEEKIARLLGELGVSDIDNHMQTLREKVAAFEQQRGQVKTRLEIAQSHKAELTALARMGAADGMSLSDPRIEDYRSLQEQIAEARVKYTENHPVLKNLMAQSRAIEDQVKDTIARTGSNLTPDAFLTIKDDVIKTEKEIADLQTAINSWTRQIDEVQAALGDYPERVAQLQTLQQRLQTSQENYKVWSARIDEIRFKESQNLGNAQIASPASNVVPKVSKGTAVILSFMVSLMLALGVGFLVEFADTTLRSPEEVANTIGLAYLGSITKLRGQRAVVFQDGKATHQAAEAYTRVYSNIKFAQVEKPIRSLMLTSARKGEGKSTTLVNLACAVAAAGKRIIIVDTDLRNPTLQRILGSRHQAGLTSVLAGERTLDETIRPTGHPGLSILPTGPIPPNPAELLHSQAMREVIADLEGRCDLVVFDSPPTLLVADAMLLGSELDAAVIVAESGGVSRKMVQQVKEALQTAQIRILGVILNKLQDTPGSAYSYYSHYKYQEPEEDIRESTIARITSGLRKSTGGRG